MLLNALIPREIKFPEGSGGSAVRQAGPGSGRVTGPRRRSSRHRSKPGVWQRSRGTDRARKQLGRTRRSRLGALTPEWRQPKGGSCCGRAKSRYERTGSGQKTARGEPGSIEPRAGKTGNRGAERRIVRRLCLRVLHAVHAGREPGWKSGHLEPFSFLFISGQSSVVSSQLRLHRRS